MTKLEALTATFALAPGKNWHTYEFPDDKAAMAFGKCQLRADVMQRTGEVFPSAIVAVASQYGEHVGAVYLSAEDHRNVLRFAAQAHELMPQLLEAVELLSSLTLIAETVAHLRGLEKEILPTTDAARLLLEKLQ